MLAANYERQRGMRRRHVEALAREMTAGRFELNGETIKLSPDGRLLDGQHRLAAVVEADIPVEMTVTRGVAESAFRTIDRGRVRSIGDYLQHSGYKSGTSLGAAINLSLTVRDMDPIVDFDEAVAFAERVRLPDNVVWAEANKAAPRRLIPPSLVATLRCVFAERLSSEDADDFLLPLLSGVDLPGGSPQLAVRRRLEDRLVHGRGRGAGGVLLRGTTEMMWACCRGWNHYILGNTIQKIQIRDPRDPVVVYGEAEVRAVNDGRLSPQYLLNHMLRRHRGGPE